jgi:copper resistance protein C
MKPRFLRAAMMLLIATALVVPGTSAHAQLDRANPEPGSTIDAIPEPIELWFSEELAAGSTAIILDPDGARVDNDDAAIDLYDPNRKHLTLTLKDSLSAGEYTVEWTTVSGEDDDTETGSYTFTLTTAATPVTSPVASPVASPAASPSPESEARVLGQAEISGDPASPDMRAFLIALGVGALAAVGIYLFWLLVKPRK